MSETQIRIRRAEPGDAAAVHEIFANPRAVSGTAQIPYPSLEEWKAKLERPPEGHLQPGGRRGGEGGRDPGDARLAVEAA
jgi:hypothetical protein